MIVPFGDLKRQYARIGAELDAALHRSVASGWYILGSEVQAFEQEFAAYCGADHCIAVASGFDALYLALAGLGIGHGDEVITVANACVYQVAAILQTGATPVLVDVDPTCHNLDPERLEAAITPRTRAIMPVHNLTISESDSLAIYQAATRQQLQATVEKTTSEIDRSQTASHATAQKAMDSVFANLDNSYTKEERLELSLETKSTESEFITAVDSAFAEHDPLAEVV